jgi:hypothetical protein
MAKINNITIKDLGENTFEVVFPRQKIDGHLRWEKGQGWILDVFDSTKKNPNKAWIESTPIKGRKKSPNWNDLTEYMGAFTS